MKVLSHFWVLGIIVPVIAILYFGVNLKPIRFSQGLFFIRDGRLYMHRVRGSITGPHTLREDWWQEVRALSSGDFQLKGREFKHNVGNRYGRTDGLAWSFPYMPATTHDIEALRKGASVPAAQRATRNRPDPTFMANTSPAQ